MTDTPNHPTCVVCMSFASDDEGLPKHFDFCQYVAGNAYGFVPGWMNTIELMTNMGLKRYHLCGGCYSLVEEVNWSLHTSYHAQLNQRMFAIQKWHETADALVIDPTFQNPYRIERVKDPKEWLDVGTGYEVTESGHTHCLGVGGGSSHCNITGDHDPHDFYWRKVELI